MPSVTIEALSFELQAPTLFRLHIQTYKFLNPNRYSHRFTELGQFEIEILKSPSPYFWKNLHNDIFYNPKNMHTWWEIYYKYREQLKDAFGLLEQVEDQRDKKEKQS